MKKIFALLMVFTFLITGCGGNEPSQKTDANSESKLVGISMPLSDTGQRWQKESSTIKNLLEQKGYTVDLEFAENDIDKQISQLDDMINHGAKCLVVSAIDSTKLLDVLAKAKENKIPVVAYERLLMETDAVSYYVASDNKAVGTALGHYVEEKLGLADGKGTFNIEFFAGSPDDNNARLVNDAVFSVLQPYIDNGQLVVPSGQTDFDTISIFRWSKEGGQQRMEKLLAEYYTDGKKVDVILSPFDEISYGVGDALENVGYKVGEDWPVITGQDAELQAVKYILAGRQSMTIFKDINLLAEKTAEVVDAVVSGNESKLNFKDTSDNNKIAVPTYFCPTIVLDKDNVKEVLVKGGYYTEAELE